MATQEAVQAIFRAAREGDAEAVASMLDEDAQLLSTECEGNPLLLEAARKGHAGVVRLLLERGAEVDAPGRYGNTAVMPAAAGGHEEVVSLLLHSNADIRRRGRWGYTALMSAAIAGKPSVVRLLLQHLQGKGLDARAASRCTALWFACRYQHLEVARALLLAGADHTIANSEGNTGQRVAQMSWGVAGIGQLITWWEGELQRGYILHKARTLYQDSFTRSQAPAAPVPAYLTTRVQGARRLPQLQIGSNQGGGGALRKMGKRPQQQEEGAEGAAPYAPPHVHVHVASEAAAHQHLTLAPPQEEGVVAVGEEEREAMCRFVAHDLAPELYVELQAALHFTEACFSRGR